MTGGECPGPDLPGQLVLVFQGGGALGAFQAGVYEAFARAGLEPDWTIGTSIGAINGAIIAGNRPQDRLTRLQSFWDGVTRHSLFPALGQSAALMEAFLAGIPGFFSPASGLFGGPFMSRGPEQAALYRTDALKETLEAHVDFSLLGPRGARLTVGAVSLSSGRMRYFDSRHEALDVRHVMASSALPPAFPAVRIDGEAYWDGGIYSNSPIEAVFDDNPRRSSVIVAVQLWDAEGPEPRNLWEVAARQKDIQYASRAESHVTRQEQIHHLRHVIATLGAALSKTRAPSAVEKDLIAWGCRTEMHILRLLLPRTAGASPLADADFSAQSIAERHRLGLEMASKAIAEAPWQEAIDPTVGIVFHDYRV